MIFTVFTENVTVYSKGKRGVQMSSLFLFAVDHKVCGSKLL